MPKAYICARPQESYVTLPKAVLDELSPLTKIGDFIRWKTDTCDKSFVCMLKSGLLFGVEVGSEVKLFEATLPEPSVHDLIGPPPTRYDWKLTLVRIFPDPHV